ncbi:MAG TPA: DUF692 domain-containing protein [Burkholderiales bacterium]
MRGSLQPSRFGAPSRLPAREGIGLRAPHYRELLERRPDVGWLEVHSENYFGAGGQPLHFLERVREHYPVSLHGVGLSLGSVDSLDRNHLRKLRALADRIEPAMVSEHLCWGSFGGRHLNDLVPLPCTEEALEVVAAHIREAQDFLGREILIENVSSYLQFAHSAIPEWEFLVEAARRGGCGILLDVNNIYVSSVNHGFDAARYLRAVPVPLVREMHLAGFDRGQHCLIDTHGRRVAEPVWALYGEALARFGPVPTLIEWDTDLPALDVLVGEAQRARALMEARIAQPA